MKRFKILLILIGVLAVLSGFQICSVAREDQEDQIKQKDSVVMAVSENDKNIPNVTETDVQVGNIVFHERGYTYAATNNTYSRTEIQNQGNVIDSEAGIEGEDTETSEIILSWDEAQTVLENDILCWLDNEYLNSCAENISFIISDRDTITAKYMMPTSEVKIQVFLVVQEDDAYFSFRKDYPSELYNLHPIEQDYRWNCFSYTGYEGTDYTGAILVDHNIVCEVTFKNCDEQFVNDTLAAYKKLTLQDLLENNNITVHY